MNSQFLKYLKLVSYLLASPLVEHMRGSRLSTISTSVSHKTGSILIRPNCQMRVLLSLGWMRCTRGCTFLCTIGQYAHHKRANPSVLSFKDIISDHCIMQYYGWKWITTSQNSPNFQSVLMDHKTSLLVFAGMRIFPRKGWSGSKAVICVRRIAYLAHGCEFEHPFQLSSFF